MLREPSRFFRSLPVAARFLFVAWRDSHHAAIADACRELTKKKLIIKPYEHKNLLGSADIFPDLPGLGAVLEMLSEEPRGKKRQADEMQDVEEADQVTKVPVEPQDKKRKAEKIKSRLFGRGRSPREVDLIDDIDHLHRDCPSLGLVEISMDWKRIRGDIYYGYWFAFADIDVDDFYRKLNAPSHRFPPSLKYFDYRGKVTCCLLDDVLYLCFYPEELEQWKRRAHDSHHDMLWHTGTFKLFAGKAVVSSAFFEGFVDEEAILTGRMAEMYRNKAGTKRYFPAVECTRSGAGPSGCRHLCIDREIHGTADLEGAGCPDIGSSARYLHFEGETCSKHGSHC